MSQKLNHYQSTGMNNIWMWFFAAFILIITTPVFSDESHSTQLTVQGFVDSVVVGDDRLTAQGWAGASTPNSHVVSISIWLADTLIYKGNYERLKRPDVAEAMNRNDWLASGWRISTALPSNLKYDKSTLKVSAKFDNGSSGELLLNDQVMQFSIAESSRQPSDKVWKYRVALLAMFILLCTVYFQADFFTKLVTSKTDFSIKPPVIFGFTLFLTFWVFIGFGITGSSLRIALQQIPFIQSDVTNIWGKDQPVRSDEYRVFTPLSIAQYNHHPKFPIVNTNLGEDGQNMLIVGMAGVPVAHISAIAKPATWGFFLFDLKRALSWYWCFPIFGCLFALWGAIALLLPGQWRSSFLIALWFSVSPYVAAWSNWPAYTVFFPSLAFISTIAILRVRSKYLMWVLGCILGVSLAGFVLVLYPPWQVSVGYVFLALTISIVIRDKLYKDFDIFKLSSYVIAIIISGLVLWEWWADAHSAIQAMMATVYPGQRTTVTGGHITLPVLLRGFTNLVTLHKANSAYSNQSEIASFSYMLLPLASLFIFRLYQKTIGAVEVSLALSISFILYFALVGIPVEVAQLSLWGRIPAERADLALGLSNIILCGLLLSSSMSPVPNKIPMSVKLLAWVVALIWMAITFHSVSRLSESIFSDFTPAMVVGLLLVVAISGYWLVLGKFREFIYLNIALSVATTLPFNPINIAPHSVVTDTSLVNGLTEKKLDYVSDQRILVLGETEVPAMYLLASGLSVASGTLYHPQKSLWERLDKAQNESNIYNRYQHLVFSGGRVENIDNYRIESPYPDIVRVVVSLENFDFRKTGAGIITALQHEEDMLRKNSTLTYLKNEKGWSWFRIIEGS